MTTTQEELVAASIREQIVHLEGLLQELERQPERTPLFRKRLRTVENELHKLRSQIKE